MELEYVYTKLRSEFGKQCRFFDKIPELIENSKPNSKIIRDYICRNPVNQHSQCSQMFASHSVNTDSAKYNNSSMNHSEGGWPKDVNIFDEEQPKRYRRKIEKEEIYVTTTLKLLNSMEHSVKQNTSVNIYEQYFENLEPCRPIEKNSVRTVNVYQDPSEVKRPVTHISWSPNTSTKLAIAYCDMQFQPVYSREIPSNKSYIWDIENPNMPCQIFKPHVPIVCLEYHVKETNCLVAGMLNGQVTIWDARNGYDYVHCSVIEESHLEPVCSAIWINSKTGSEFFTGSSDGQTKWWDIRKLSAPTETLILDLVRFGEDQQLSRAQGASCLEYEPSIPTRFMVGTEHGYVITGNRKGKNHLEKLVSKAKTMNGPVYALQRNSAFTKIYICIGDCNCYIWSEDCKENSIIALKSYKTPLTGGMWSPTRFSVFYLTRYDGVFDIWDIIQYQNKPMMSVKLCDDPLTAIRSHDDGHLAVIGNKKGITFLVQMSDNFCTNMSHEKAFLSQMFDRETAREKIMDAKLRELKLRSNSKNVQDIYDEDEESPDIIKQRAEEEFYTIIEEQLKPEPLPKTELQESEPQPVPVPAPVQVPVTVPVPVPEPISVPVPAAPPSKKEKGKKKGKK